MSANPPSPTKPLTRTSTASEIRAAFIDYFRTLPGHEHTFVSSSPAAPVDDPTLLFTNAGMNQFKPCFLGTVEKGSPLDGVERAVNSQKCIRAGGKHNDLDDVGLDTYHHTFFEMLGNWSFGDFFKTEIIEWSFKFLTEICQLEPDRLYATYFEGDPSQDLLPDYEARDLWLRYLPEDRVLPGSYKDNFWEMGDVGPCGPCSEIHYDRIGGRNAAALVNQDDPDVLEIWNLVFIQFNRERSGDGTILKPLPAKHVDTGMGLERLVSVIQDVRSNYDTDLFTPLFEAIQKVTGFDRPYQGKLGADDPDRIDMAYRVIADHIRTLVVAITDGATPSNEGRGYVLRRVLRRAVRFGRQMLGAQTGFLTDLVPTVAETLKNGFPELAKNTARVAEIIRDEEESFGKTLDKGIVQFTDIAWELLQRDLLGEVRKDFCGIRWNSSNILGDAGTVFLFGDDDEEIIVPQTAFDKARSESKLVFPGEDAFTLYDTYGFPLDLTQIMAEERGLKVDVEGFERAMEEQRERSRAGSKFGAGESEIKLEPDDLARLAHMNVNPTDTSGVDSHPELRARIMAIVDEEDFEEKVDAANSALKRHGLVLDATNFYAEAGGQVADTGTLFVLDEHRRAESERRQSEFRVEAVKRFGDFVLHIGRITRGVIRVGDEVECHIESRNRELTRANHTATHLLNLALREVLGETVDQKGSLVTHERLRFDFSHNKPMTDEEVMHVENIVRKNIDQDLPVSTGLAPLETAKSIAGLRAVFGEKYPDPVRVVSVGQPVEDLIANPSNESWRPLSIEFCGGTHARTTNDIGDFVIVSETGIAKGVRRIEALTGVAATAAIASAKNLSDQIDALRTTPDTELTGAIAEVSTQIDELTLSATHRAELRAKLGVHQERAKAAAKAAAGQMRETAVKEARALAESAQADARPFIVGTLSAGEDRGALQAALKVLQDTCPHAGALLASAGDERVAIIAWVPDDQIKKGLKAGDWVRTAAEACGGKGGGKPNQAQGGGTDIAKLADAAQAAEAFAAKHLY